MPENSQTEGDAKSAKKTDRNPLRAAKSLFKRLPIGLRRITIGALIIFLFIVTIAVFHPSLNERWKFGTDMTLNLLILLAIAVQAYIYSGQWESMQNQLEAIQVQADAAKTSARAAEISATAAQESARISADLFAAERPDVQIKSSALVLPLNVNHAITLQFGLINKGSRTAYRVRVDANHFFTPRPFAGNLPEYRPSNTPASESTIGRDLEVTATLPLDLTLDADQLKALKEHEATIFFYGVIEYRDARNTYVEQFCRMFNSDNPAVLAHCPYSRSVEQEGASENQSKNPN